MEKYRKYAIVFSVIGLVLILTGVTYSFFNYTKTGLANNFSVGDIYFNTSQNGNINLTNVFPITSNELSTDIGNHDSVTISITGSTDYGKGIEYLVTIDQVSNKINGKRIPMTFNAEVTGVGTTSNDYYNSRGGSSSLYKLYDYGKIKNGNYLLVGYIAPGATGINGSITVTAFVDADRIAITDTPEENASWVDDREVFSTSEWNSFQGNNSLSFKVKVEANEGTWVRDLGEATPDSCFVVNEAYGNYIRNSNMTSTELNDCVDYLTNVEYWNFDSNSGTAQDFCNGTGVKWGNNFQQMLDNNYFTSREIKYFSEHNIILVTSYETSIIDYDDSCSKYVVIPETITAYNKEFYINPNSSNDDLRDCADYLAGSLEWGCDPDESLEDYCAGTGTVYGETFQEHLDSGYFNYNSLLKLEETHALASIATPHNANITVIEGQAFEGKGLKSVTLPDTLKNIYYDAFRENMIETVILPVSVTDDMCNRFVFDNFVEIEQGNNTYSCGCLITSTQNNAVTINNYDYACTKDVVIPETINGKPVVTIGNEAFRDRDLTSVVIPNSVTSIGDYAFENDHLDSVVLPSSITSIGHSAFSTNNLTSIVIPENVTTIEQHTFRNNHLTSVTLPSNLTTIKNYAFANNSITSITLPNTLTSVGEYAFNSNSISSLTTPSSLTTINRYAFANNNISTLNLTNGVETIKESAFYNNQLTSVTIPDSVTKLEASSFVGTNQVTSITLGSGLTQTNSSNNPGFYSPAAFALSNITYIDKETIGDNFFKYSPATASGKLRNNLTLGNHVKSIGNYAFENNDLTSVTIPDSVETIGGWAFSGNKLTSITVGNGVTSIGTVAFNKNTSSNKNLATITIDLPCSTIRSMNGYYWIESEFMRGTKVYGSNNEVCY